MNRDIQNKINEAANKYGDNFGSENGKDLCASFDFRQGAYFMLPELNAATEKYDHARIELRSYDQILDEKNKEIQSLKDENKKFREALEFYANGGNPNRDIWFDEKLGYFTGKRARQTLEGVSK